LASHFQRKAYICSSDCNKVLIIKEA